MEEEKPQDNPIEKDESKTSLCKEDSKLRNFEISNASHDSDRYRMWAAVSFAVMLLVVGVPLWWKTTEVERSPLPYQAISNLDPSRLTLSSTIYISTEFPTLYNSIRSRFLIHFKQDQSSVYRLDVVSKKIQLDEISVETVEVAQHVHPAEPGILLLIQVPQLAQQTQILVSTHRIIYFTKSTDEALLVETVMSWMLEEKDLSVKMSSMLEPQNAENGAPTRLRAATSYDFVFTIVNSDPSRINLSFDIKSYIKQYVDPLLNQLKEVGKHRARSQWIHLLDLSGLAERMPDSVYMIASDFLPHIITPLEKRLGSGVCGVSGCVQLVLYITPCTPLVFGPTRSLSMTALPWGSVQILNPPDVACSNTTTTPPYTPRPAPLMATFLSQIHSLLGFTNPENLPGVSLMRKIGPELREWQLDALYRMRALEQLTSASLTLKSLAKLLGEIGNIVINSEVARCVEVSVVNVEEGLELLSRGRLLEALRSSQRAFLHAEKAFTDPSLLALLYFPDDQKYAVYIPLFLPIMIPVFMSLKPIYKWALGG